MHPSDPPAKQPLRKDRPYVIAHRGSSGELPEHTLEAYQRAIDQGADFIECDVVLTKDLVPVCRHEPLVSGTTDADIKFPSLKKDIIIDGSRYSGVFTTDLTLAQVKTLRTKQQNRLRPNTTDGLYLVPTLEEYIKVAQASKKRVVGIYPETKHPMWHDSLDIVKNAGTTMSDIVLGVLSKYGYTGPVNSAAWNARPVFIQSFEYGNLKALSRKTCIPLVFLMVGWAGSVTYDLNRTHAEMTTDASLDDLATFVSGVGPWKNTLLTSSFSAGSWSYKSTGLLERLHARGLQVHPYTFRDEANYYSWAAPSVMEEYRAFFLGTGGLPTSFGGIDGAFADFPATLRHFVDANKPRKYVERGQPANLQRTRACTVAGH